MRRIIYFGMENCPKCDKFSPLVTQLMLAGIPIAKHEWETTQHPNKPKYPPALLFLDGDKTVYGFFPIDLFILNKNLNLFPELYDYSSAEEFMRYVCKKHLDIS